MYGDHAMPGGLTRYVTFASFDHGLWHFRSPVAECFYCPPVCSINRPARRCLGKWECRSGSGHPPRHITRMFAPPGQLPFPFTWCRTFPPSLPSVGLQNKKLSCRRKTAQCFLLLSISLSRSRSFKVIWNGYHSKTWAPFPIRLP